MGLGAGAVRRADWGVEGSGSVVGKGGGKVRLRLGRGPRGGVDGMGWDDWLGDKERGWGARYMDRETWAVFPLRVG